MPDGDELDLLCEVKSAYSYIEVVLLTDYGMIDTAGAAILRVLHICSTDKSNAGVEPLLCRKMTNLKIDLQNEFFPNCKNTRYPFIKTENSTLLCGSAHALR